ncbi:Protein_phosphatase 2C [Hexamita inflata]|uniref:Protein phosphatase 2C n=2 Tax=Hexamita inflata TaxID=28002 RepID=A0AA86UYL8_9EUKA|nr:Protein phosphatase 2C [Hexamita inflata]CAI9969702.1 Protein phosphatase 2C [Hexamita inflata]
MTQFQIPVQIAPVIYTEEQMKLIEPQLDELISQCNELIERASKTVEAASDCCLQAAGAEKLLTQPLKLQNRVHEASFAVKQLKRKAGLLPPHPQFKFKSGHCTILGKRPTNEDAHVMENFEHEGRNYTLTAVFDGHAGDAAAKYCAQHFKKQLISQDSFNAQPIKAMKQAFVEMDADFCAISQMSGCTATAMLFEHGAENTLLTANAGDARIIFRANDQLQAATIDHKPSSPGEKARVEAAGSFVTTIFGVARVAGQLAVSRAIGDYDYKQFGVTAEPETYSYTDLDDLKYVVCACDGLYDVLSNEEIDYAVMSALNAAGAPNGRQQLIGDAMKLYVNGKTREGDELLMKNANSCFVNFMACVEPKMEFSFEQRIATALTRIAYLLGSMDNITAIVLVASE